MQIDIAQLTATPFALDLRQPLQLSSGTMTRRCGVIVEIRDRRGVSGIGEASPAPSAGEDQAREIARTLTELANHLQQQSQHDYQTYWDLLPSLAVAARCGLQAALLDLRARCAGAPLHQLLGTSQRQRVAVNAMIDRLPAAQTARAAVAARDAGFPCIKIKIAPGDLANLREVLETTRAAVGDSMAIRIDANAGWSESQAIEALRQLEPLRLEYVEQPVASLEAMARVRARVQTPIAADESISGPTSVIEAAKHDAADVIIVKPSRIGLTESVETIAAARDHQLAVVVTSNLDSAIGIAATLHLCATIKDDLRPCGLATTGLWAADLSDRRLIPSNGHLEVPAGDGIGIGIDRAVLERRRID